MFFLIFIAQLALTTYKIGNVGFWYDECFSVNCADRPIADIIEVSRTDQNPPLYPIILHYWISYFGITEFAVRMLSAIASSLACSFLFLFAMRFFNWQTAVFATLMYFTSNDLFYYSQEARTYAIITLVVILSNFCFLAISQNPKIWKGIMLGIFLGLLNISLFYLHYLSCFMIVAQGILFPIFFTTNPGFLKDGGRLLISASYNINFLIYYLISWIVFFIIFYPWLERFMFLVTEGGKSFWLAKPSSWDFKHTIYELFNSKENYQAYIYSFVLIVLLLIIKRFRSEKINVKFLLFALISGPILIFINYEVAQISPVFLKRYVLFTFIGFILTFSYVFSLLKLRFEYKFLIAFCLAFYAMLHMKVPRESYYDYKEAVPYLISKKHENTLITTDMPDLFSYYFARNDIFRVKEYGTKAKLLADRGIYVQYDLAWVNREDLSKYKDIYYTRSFDDYSDPNGLVDKALKEKFELVDENRNYKGLKISHFINKNYK
ncbi:MAG: glycosyltransferase family 39 protein [Bacteroidota bacterium]